MAKKRKTTIRNDIYIENISKKLAAARKRLDDYSNVVVHAIIDVEEAEKDFVRLDFAPERVIYSDSPPPIGKARPATSTFGAELCCSFCGKSARDVKKLIAGPTVYICSECVGLCQDIINEDVASEAAGNALPKNGGPSSGTQWWHVLGVQADSATDSVRAAYKTKAQSAHPDRGGSHEAMTLVNLAWMAFEKERGL